jgi:GxxExxY protein
MEIEGTSLLLKDEVYSIISCSIEILNGMGHGLYEKPYENALAVELRHRGIYFVQQPRFPVQWRGVAVGEYVPDLIAYDQVIIDTKTIDRITDHERGQMMNYLRITKLPVGLIINFKHRKLEWVRIALTQ